MSDLPVAIAVAQAELVADLPDRLVRSEAEVRHARRETRSSWCFRKSWIPGYPAWLDV